MISIDSLLTPENLKGPLGNFWDVSGEKILAIDREYDESKGAPVYTVKGKYTTRGWTEWTQGFQFGSALLQYDATGLKTFLDLGRQKTLGKMAAHISHTGVHDHGFNNISTYGNLLRFIREGRFPAEPWETHFYELALKISGAIQAARWTEIRDGGYIYSFNGPHSLFVDTIRSCRILMLSHALGHSLQTESDMHINLLERALIHLLTTSAYNIYYGEGRDIYDVRGRTAHESIFNIRDGRYRCPNSQQGYTGRSTWTRGLAWAMCGFAEELEFLETVDSRELEAAGGRKKLEAAFLRAATATCDFYIDTTPTDGIPYWDTGAPGLHRLGDYRNKPADPFNQYEPVDSSAAAIAAQGLLRLGHYLASKGKKEGERYWQAGLTVMHTLLDEPYLSTDKDHQGLILHSVYHQPNGWDHIPPGKKIPMNESSMWGDYHIREAALYLGRIIDNAPYYTFFNCLPS